MTVEAMSTLLSALGAAALGALVLTRSDGRVTHWSFSWGMAGLASAEMGRLMVLLRLGQDPLNAWLRVSFAAEALALPVWATFGVVFARVDISRELRHWRWALLGFGALALGGVAVAAFAPLTVVPADLDDGVVPLTVAGKYLNIFALLASLFVLVQLEATLRRSSGIDRWRIKYFILGLFGVFGFRLFVLSHTLLDNAFRLQHLTIQSTAFLLSLALVGFSLARYRLLEVRVFVSRHVVYHSFTVGVVGAYLLAVGVAGYATQAFDIPVHLFLTSLTVFVTAMALLIVLLSEAVRRRVRRSIAGHFYRHKYDYRQQWAEFTRRLASVVSPEGIPPRVVALVADALGVQRVALLLSDEEGNYGLAGSTDGDPRDLHLRLDGRRLAGRVPDGSVLALDRLGGDDALAEPVDRLRARGYTLVVPLTAQDGVVGLLAVGWPGGLPLTQEDEELLTIMAAQAATAILNARLSERLAQGRQLEALSRVSTFMLHDLKNCVSMLSLVAQNAATLAADPAFQRDAFRTVAQTVGKMREFIGRLSHLPKGPELRLVPVDLNGLVEEVAERARAMGTGRIPVALDLAPLPPILTDAEQVRTVLDNLLLNALEALGDEGEVRIRTVAHNGSVSLEMSDTGPGIPDSVLRAGLFTPFNTTKPHGLGIGLYQVKFIVHAHGGHLQVTSAPGRGTAVRITFPAAPA